jgi:hypothetical protein
VRSVIGKMTPVDLCTAKQRFGSVSLRVWSSVHFLEKGYAGTECMNLRI